MNKKELKKTLDKAGVKYPEDATSAQLKDLLPPKEDKDAKPSPQKEAEKTAEAVSNPQPPKAKGDSDVTVGSPQELRPKDLPLVITRKGGWKNDKQAEFAAVLNAYAYRNPEKWDIKKSVLLAQLEEIGNNPEAIVKYRGNEAKVSFKNKLMQE